MALCGSRLTSTATKGAFLHLGELVLDTSASTCRWSQRWTWHPVPTADVDTGLRVTDFSFLKGRLLLRKASKGAQAPRGGSLHR